MATEERDALLRKIFIEDVVQLFPKMSSHVIRAWINNPSSLRKFLARLEPPEINVIYPAEFDPAVFIAPKWKWANVDADINSLQQKCIDLSEVKFDTCLIEGETSITGEEKLRRLVAKNCIRIDPRFGNTLYSEKGQLTLEYLYIEHKVTDIDFFGRILENQGGFRHVLNLRRYSNGDWDRSVRFLDRDCSDQDFTAYLPN